MSERRAPYLDSTVIDWVDVRFSDGKHSGVRVLRGTTIIEVQREGRKMLIDTATCLPVDLTIKGVYNRSHER